MRCVDQDVDMLALQIISKPVGPAKTADPHRHRLARRRGGAAGKRQRHVKIAARRQPLGQRARFRGAAKDEDLFRHAAP